MLKNLGACVVQECNPYTNQISEVSVPCGCHPGQKPAYVPPQNCSLPECYINNDDKYFMLKKDFVP